MKNIMKFEKQTVTEIWSTSSIHQNENKKIMKKTIQHSHGNEKNEKIKKLKLFELT